MKPHSIVCNRCRLVCVKFYFNRCRFTVVIAKCLGGSLFSGHSVCAEASFDIYDRPIIDINVTVSKSMYSMRFINTLYVCM